jgi:hypothetical protein
MTKRTKFGESTVLVSIRVPESKKEEILNRFYSVLNDYIIENPFIWKDGKVDTEVVPKWKQDLEKKSNPTDDTIEIVVENKAPELAKKHKQVLKVAKDYNVGVIENGEIKFTPNAQKNTVDMDALRKIASGEGLKSELFTKKKLPLDELYEFEYVKSLPDIDNQVAIDSKGISLYDRYDPGIFYVKWEGKYLRFDNKAEFDRFANDHSIK